MRSAFGKLAAMMLIIAAIATAAAPAHAWKPTMHAFLADIALRDAIDDGKITINRVNYETGQVLGLVNTYNVDAELLQALRRFPDHYRAGVVGPDGYPDIVTGQQCIHVDGPDGSPGGTNAWLEYIWARSQLPSLTGDKRLKARAFAAGYLTHAAGDMYAHTFVNFFTGGDFVIGQNGVRHFVMEGYIGKRCPPPTLSISVSGIEDWIYDTLIDARKGTFLSERLLIGANRFRSLGFLFSKLRDKLVADVDEFHRHGDDVGTILGSGIQTKYKEAWIKDIDRGLLQLVTVSHDLTKELFMTPDLNSESISRAKEILRRYMTLHVLSMAGAPDFVGLTLNKIHEITEAIVNAIFPQFVKDFIKQIKEDILNYFLVKYTGMTIDQIKSFLTSPEQHFDPVMFTANTGSTGGARVTMAQMNRDHFKINDPGFTNPGEKFVVEKFSPAYNTMVLSKLILLPQAEVNRLVADLNPGVRPGQLPTVLSRGLNDRALQEQRLMGGQLKAMLLADARKDAESKAPPGGLLAIQGKLAFLNIATGPVTTLNASNIMLGYNRKIDGDNQWHVNANKMVLVHAGKYDQIFMKFAGDRTPIGTAPTPPPPPEDPFVQVTVVINRVAQIGKNIDPPFNGDADFYTKVSIDGENFVTDDFAGKRVITPNWTFRKQVLRSRGTIPIRIEIWDEDSNGRGDDDQIDVNPATGRGMTLQYDLRSRRFTGPATGASGIGVTVRGNESDNADLTFTVTGT